jgi:hypothetical protein
MAAFCPCCGAEITLKAGSCRACGKPQHGMLQPDLLLTLDVGADAFREDAFGSGVRLRTQKVEYEHFGPPDKSLSAR